MSKSFIQDPDYFYSREFMTLPTEDQLAVLAQQGELLIQDGKEIENAGGDASGQAELISRCAELIAEVDDETKRLCRFGKRAKSIKRSPVDSHRPAENKPDPKPEPIPVKNYKPGRGMRWFPYLGR